MSKLIPSPRTLDAAKAVLNSKDVNAELGVRAGMPQHERWQRNVQELRDAVVYGSPLSDKAIDGAMALYANLRLGSIGLDYVAQGLPLPGSTPEVSRQRYEMHRMVNELRVSIMDDLDEKRSHSLFAGIGRRFQAMLS
jgi:hypothetical protein